MGRTIHGRGTAENPTNRFVALTVLADPDGEEGPAPKTQFFRDSTRRIIARNDSPDVGFSASINPYRGCEHGCIYCFARLTHEYLDLSAGLDFETKIMVKENAPQLLARELADPKWKPQTLQLSGVTDCYQPVERRLKLTRSCLEVLAEFRNPVSILTKNHLITRDIDLLGELAKHKCVVALVSVTTLNSDLTRVMEPRTSTPSRRLDAIAKLAAAGIPVGVMVAPIIPGLNDQEIPAIVQAVAQAGASWVGYTLLRLPFAVADLFQNWLTEHFPDRKEKILNRIRSMRGGKLNDPNFKTRMTGSGIWPEQIKAMFDLAKRRAGLIQPFPVLSSDSFRRPVGSQLGLFE